MPEGQSELTVPLTKGAGYAVRVEPIDAAALPPMVQVIDKVQEDESLDFDFSFEDELLARIGA